MTVQPCMGWIPIKNKNKKKTKCDNLDDNEKDKSRKYEKEEKKALLDKLNVDKKYEKWRVTKEKKQIVTTLMIMKKNNCDNITKKKERKGW